MLRTDPDGSKIVGKRSNVRRRPGETKDDQEKPTDYRAYSVELTNDG